MSAAAAEVDRQPICDISEHDELQDFMDEIPDFPDPAFFGRVEG